MSTATFSKLFLSEAWKLRIILSNLLSLIGGNSPVSNVLLEASLVIKNNKSRNSCDHRRYINYCALDEAENSNICQGDSGGCNTLKWKMVRLWIVKL
ncbi:unnamed protein product [Brachionus calyciflorus]|uniref:Uncharacterized protein n=1 Tax=Brachionus calyciflorus TaxID=104777 RepID=A0A814GF95_9BILA|nr:unnamed protein product [Brachionus calyciflorus]